MQTIWHFCGSVNFVVRRKSRKNSDLFKGKRKLKTQFFFALLFVSLEHHHAPVNSK